MKIPEHIQKLINEESIHIMSTSSKEGIPNINYVKFLKVYNDEQILIADNKFFKTEKNLLENPKISFILLDKENKKSYQLKGTVEFHKDDEIFSETIKWVEKERLGSSTFPKSAIIMTVKEIYSGAEKISEK